ncbi:MAG TPA: hypothetical protein VJU61_11205 [Polyangiaceae bacterium]|nr:hypothetical protein [Polyangiaceae bacterium]
MLRRSALALVYGWLALGVACAGAEPAPKTEPASCTARCQTSHEAALQECNGEPICVCIAEQELQCCKQRCAGRSCFRKVCG